LNLKVVPSNEGHAFLQRKFSVCLSFGFKEGNEKERKKKKRKKKRKKEFTR